jgi:hypothetical protein
MKRLMPAIIVIAILLVAVGFYRGWFVVSGSSGETGEQKMNVNVSVDKEKMQGDVEAVKNEASKVTGSQH